MSTLSEPSGSFSDETEAQNEANGDDSVRSVAGSDADGFSDRQGEGVKTEQKFTNEKATTPTDTHSRFFVPISAGDSRRYLMALHTALSSCAEANPPPAAKNAVRLAVNVPINVDSLNRQELYDYYRAYITRLLNVLFLCGEAGRCTDYAYKHFSREYAARLCLAFETHRRCQNTAVAVVMHDGRICNQLAIDGYLLYRESHNTARRPKGTAFCALPSPIQERRDTTTVLKIKPFQTVELLMRVNIEGTAGHGVNETVRLAAIEFLSHLRSDGSPSVFFTCTFKTVATEETVTMTPQGSTVNGNAVTRKPLCTMSPDFTSARWTRYDGKSMRVFVDPRLELVDGLVYEFLCYNELELYLIKARPDKVLPDDEMKINSILWGRYSSDLFFVS